MPPINANAVYQEMLKKLLELRPPEIVDASGCKNAGEFLKVFADVVDGFIESYGKAAEYEADIDDKDMEYFKGCLMVSIEGSALFILENAEEEYEKKQRERREWERSPGAGAAHSAGVD